MRIFICLLALSMPVANSALAADDVNASAAAVPQGNTNPAVSGTAPDTVSPVDPAKINGSANTAEPAKVEEPGKAKPASHTALNIGIETFKDMTVPGQEVSQMNIPVGLTFETGKVTFEISIPYIQRTAPSGKIASSEHHESKKESATPEPAVNSSGLGDVTSSLMFTLLNEKEAPLSLYAKGKFKFATADLASGLGTGQNDYSGELKVKKSLGDFTGITSIGYAVLGSPGDVKINDVSKSIYFNNIYFGSLGCSYQFTERLNAGMNLDLGQASETGGFAQRDLSAGMEFEFSKSKSLHLQMMKSLTPGLSIWGASMSLSTSM